jgi:hypothetical protein
METIFEYKSKRVETLFDIYKEDRYSARVVYMNDTSNYLNYRLVKFTKDNGHFSIVLFRRKYGISISNKIYSRESRLMSIHYNGRFYFSSGSHVRPLTMQNLGRHIPYIDTHARNIVEIILDDLEARFTWLRYIRENGVLWDVAFNTIIKNKLYSKKKALQYSYGACYPVAKMLHEKSGIINTKEFKKDLRYLENVESFKESWLTKDMVHIFKDSLRMAKVLDKRINCSWSNRRLEEEHDKWAKELTDIVYDRTNRPLNIDNVFTDFRDHSGLELISTTKELNYEGKKQNHCVASYVSSIESGLCAIFRYKDYTAEVRHWDRLELRQLKGYKNKNAPISVNREIIDKIEKFNTEVYEKENYNSRLPF